MFDTDKKSLYYADYCFDVIITYRNPRKTEQIKKIRVHRNVTQMEITGLRRDESPKRAKLPIILYKRRIPSWSYAPILLWTEKHVFRYLEEHDLPIPPQYRMGFKETCMCGCFAQKKEIMLLKATYPELFQRFVELEGKFRKDWACWSHCGKPLYAKDLAQQKNLEEWAFPNRMHAGGIRNDKYKSS